MRSFRIAFLLILLAQGSSALAGMAIDLDYACFRGRDTLVYVEVYASVQRSQLDYVPIDSGLAARFRLIVTVALDGGAVACDTLHGLDIVADSSELKVGQFFPYVSAFYMKPGVYQAQAILENAAGVIREQKGLPLSVEPIRDDSLTMSDLELACLVEKTDEVSRFWKNGLRVLPNPVRFYGTQLPLFYYYCELYNFRYSPDSPDSFLIQRQIRAAETGTVVRRLPACTKKKAGPTAVEADAFPITTLSTGTYVFDLQVTDLYTNVTSEMSKKFWIYRPEDFAAGREMKTDTLFVGRVAEFALPALEIENAELALEQMRYILTPEENARTRRLTPEGKVQFMREYWVRAARDEASSPEIVRWRYFQRVEEANRRFSLLKKEGWKTDRGRVYIRLGSPDLVDYHTAQQEAPDHEIWYYDRIEGGVQFVFADKTGFGDLELVHSTKRGEISDPNWLQTWTGRAGSEPSRLSR
ncbi:MAG: GWxTD domain-containing protein [Calditrichaeota bacterium]|nr:GWxTD domain-containing protein [Calditrichota bacterium]